MKVSMKEQGEVFFLQIEGRLEIEKIKLLTTELQTKYQNKKILFCLEKLSFVGSCGIQKFFLDLEGLQRSHQIQAKIVGLPKDFQFMLRFTEMASLEFVDNVQVGLDRFLSPLVESPSLTEVTSLQSALIS